MGDGHFAERESRLEILSQPRRFTWPQLEGKKCLLRGVVSDDVQMIRSWIADVDVPWAILDDYGTLTTQRLLPWVYTKRPFSDYSLAWIVMGKATGGPIGLVMLEDVWHLQRRAGPWLTIIAPSYRGNGYAIDATHVMIRYAFDYLNLHRLWTEKTSVTDPEKALSHLPVTHEGIERDYWYHKGRWIDRHIHSVLSTDQAWRQYWETD